MLANFRWNNLLWLVPQSKLEPRPILGVLECLLMDGIHYSMERNGITPIVYKNFTENVKLSKKTGAIQCSIKTTGFFAVLASLKTWTWMMCLWQIRIHLLHQGGRRWRPFGDHKIFLQTLQLSESSLKTLQKIPESKLTFFERSCKAFQKHVKCDNTIS